MEEQQKKIYKIGDREFTLRENLTLKERHSLKNVMKHFRIHGINPVDITGDLTLAESHSFFGTILKPVDGKEVPPSIFDSLNEETEVKITADFFISRINLTSDLIRYFESWKKNTKVAKMTLNN